jgi:hypothetical protein
MNYFSISVLEGVRLLLISFHNNSKDLDEAKKLAEISNPSKSKYDFDSAYKLISEYGEEYFTISEDNEIKILRSNLYKIITALNPEWIKKVDLGRNFVFDSINKLNNEVESQEIFHTFRVCNLKDDNDIDTVLWWKYLSEFYRNNNLNIEKGIDGEFLSLRYEIKKLQDLNIDRQPLLKSIDDETLGYDILSFRMSSDTTYNIYIEAKFSNNNQFFLTKNEWNTANKYMEKYFIYFWDGESDAPKIINFEELKEYILDDKENSTWDKLVINI